MIWFSYMLSIFEDIWYHVVDVVENDETCGKCAMTVSDSESSSCLVTFRNESETDGPMLVEKVYEYNRKWRSYMYRR